MTMTNIYCDNMHISMITNDSVIINNKLYNIPEYVKRNGTSITINNGKLYISGYEVTPNGEFIPSNNSNHTNSISINSFQNTFDDIFDDIDDELSATDELMDEFDILLALNGIF